MPQALANYMDEKSLIRLGQGIALGFAFVGIFGFGWFGVPNLGFTKAATATQMAKQGYTQGQISILAPECALGVQQLPEAAAMKAKFAAATSNWDYSRAFESADAKKLAMMPGSSYQDNDLAAACGKAVLKAEKTAAK